MARRVPAMPAASGSSAIARRAGRGRRGSAWETARGNLAASLFLPVEPIPPSPRRSASSPAWRSTRRFAASRRSCRRIAMDGLDRRRPPGDAASPEMAERCAARRRQARRHPARGASRSPTAGWRWSSASASTSSRRRGPALSGRRRSPASASSATRSGCLRGAVRCLGRHRADLGRGQGLSPNPRSVADRAAGVGEEVGHPHRRRGICVAGSRPSTMRAG